MLDIVRIRNNKEEIEKLLKNKGFEIDFSKVIKLDDKRKEIIQEVEKLKALRNSTSASIPKMKKEGKDVTPIFEEMRQLGDKIVQDDEKLSKVQEEINAILCVIPNIPDSDLKPGEKENNEVIRVVNPKREFDFKIRDHVELATMHQLIDYDRGVKLSGNGFWIYRGMGARLEWALLNFFIEEHIKDGYEFILPPHQLNYACGYGAGQFPKFAEEVYWLDCATEREKNRFMLPTAETALVNMYSNEIIEESKLPFKFFAYTPCYRKEAGSARKEERGMIKQKSFHHGTQEMERVLTKNKKIRVTRDKMLLENTSLKTKSKPVEMESKVEVSNFDIMQEYLNLIYLQKIKEQELRKEERMKKQNNNLEK